MQHAPLLNLFSGMPFITPNLGKANSMAISLQIEPQKIPYLALESIEYIPENDMILREYGYIYLENSYFKDVLKNMVIWNKNGEETSLALYNITRGQIEQFKEALKSKNDVYCMSILRSTVPDFLYHLSPEEMSKVKGLVDTYQGNEEDFQSEKDLFIQNRYPQYISYLNQLELTHRRLVNTNSAVNLFYEKFFKGNDPEEIFNHRHSAFNLLKANLFHYPDEDEKFNKDKYYLSPIDHFLELELELELEQQEDLKHRFTELSTQALNHYKAKDYSKAVKLWQDALIFSKDVDFYRFYPNHELWKTECSKENALSPGGGPIIAMTGKFTLAIIWNLAKAYQKLEQYQDAIYFFDSYITIATLVRKTAKEVGAESTSITDKKMKNAEEYLNNAYQNYLSLDNKESLEFN